MAVAPLLHQCFKLTIVPVGKDNSGGDEQVTGADRGRLNQIAQAVYDQMEKKS